MLLLLPILVPLIGGIFVFRQKNETYRDWLVVTCRNNRRVFAVCFGVSS